MVFLGGIAATASIVGNRPRATPEPRRPVAPLVRVVEARSQTVQLSVRANGTVAPRTEIDLVPEVSGRVVFVAPSLASGGFFDANETLLRLDARDYELALSRTRAEVARAELRVAREEAEAAVARREWQALTNESAPPLAVREPQVAEARAELSAARAAMERAELDLSRTKLSVPFSGRVREKNVDLGQFVQRGNRLGRVYSVEVAEVRLPIPDDQLAFLDLPLGRGGDLDPEPSPMVTLSATFGGRLRSWSGRIVRTEGELDPRSRMLQAVVQVRDPYDREKKTGLPPLAIGMFVDAEVTGHTLENVFVVPRVAMRGPDSVLVVGPDSRLGFRKVHVLRFERQRVIIDKGLQDGDTLCVSPLDAVVDGMPVRVAAAPVPGAAAEPSSGH